MLGCYGHRPRRAPSEAVTPAIDRLAAEGVRMVDAYAPSSWTLPSHFSLFTGEPPLVHGVETEVGTIDPATPTLAEILQRHGYRTGGVYSAPYLEPHWGFARGFDRYAAAYAPDVLAASARADAIRVDVEGAAAAGEWSRYDELKRAKVGVDAELNRASEEAVTSDRVTADVVGQLDELARDGRPWFLFAHFFDPHCDYVPPPPYDTRFDPGYAGSVDGRHCVAGPGIARPDPDRPGGLVREIADRDLEHVVALYEGEIAWVDDHVGRILAALDGLGLAHTTLVVVVSDHGEEFFDHGNLGHRHNLNEEVVRVPIVLRLPGALPAGAAVRGPVSLTDVLPTVLDILGLPPASAPGSASFVPLIRGGEAPAARTVLYRLVMMFAGDVAVDATNHVALREVMVEDGFRTGPVKITRARMWPQFPADIATELRAEFEHEAARQYAREDLGWVDLDRSPDAADDARMTDFGTPAARAALDEFRRQYATLAGLRRRVVSPLPENVRRRVESLGYVTASGAAFPEPDVVLPPPRGG